MQFWIAMTNLFRRKTDTVDEAECQGLSTSTEYLNLIPMYLIP